MKHIRSLYSSEYLLRWFCFQVNEEDGEYLCTVVFHAGHNYTPIPTSKPGLLSSVLHVNQAVLLSKPVTFEKLSKGIAEAIRM